MCLPSSTLKFSLILSVEELSSVHSQGKQQLLTTASTTKPGPRLGPASSASLGGALFAPCQLSRPQWLPPDAHSAP
jgi:hypothetical protein